MTTNTTDAKPHLDFNDPKYASAAAYILDRHNHNEPEANITSAVRDFLVLTNLSQAEEIKEENPPSDSSRRAVDLTAHDTFVEMKRRVGTTGGNSPNPDYIQQLDDYLFQSQTMGKGVRMGVLTDGKHWLLRWSNAGPVKTTYPYAFTLESSEQWLGLYEWLRDKALVSQVDILPTRNTIVEHFGAGSLPYQRDIASLKALYLAYADHETIKLKRRLWYDLLRTALGEIARSQEELDDLFVRHTYLSAVVAMVVQATFGIDIYQMAETDPADLLQGRQFRNDTGLQGVVESDFFTWPTEVGGNPFLRTLARRLARFDWSIAPADVAAILYETVIPPEERRQLGEYYTPGWLARTMVRELVTDPLDQHVLDPACGSGTFIAEAVSHFIDASESSSLHPKQLLDRLRMSVTGIDVHPVAVHLARSAWALAAKPAILAAKESGFDASGPVPVYLGDSLQLRFRTGDMFAEHEVRIEVEDGQNTALVFPVRLVDEPSNFDALMGDVSEYIEHGDDPYVALDDHKITEENEKKVLSETIATLQDLHSEGRDHIWAYYTRNLVRPVALARRKVDVIVGNPPWIIFRNTAFTLRTELERQSKEVYGIWAGGKYAAIQDVSGLFFARCTDLYLKDTGVIGMVLPHSALRTGQYAKWRSGSWESKRIGRGRNRTPQQTIAVDFGHKTSWDLERLEPNTFFPMPASVFFAKRAVGGGKPLGGVVEQWSGVAGAPDVSRIATSKTDSSMPVDSPYSGFSRKGADIYPRRFYFVERIENPAVINAGQTISVNPREGTQGKQPWASLDLAVITGQAVEAEHLFEVHLGETLVPYATLQPLEALLPFKRGDSKLPLDADGDGGISPSGLDRRMRGRWKNLSELWERHKRPVNKLSLAGRLDYHRELSAQLEWQQNSDGRAIRIIYSGYGQPTAAVLPDINAIVDYKLFWVSCKDVREAHYLLAVVNSEVLYSAVTPLMSKGQFGARDLQKHLWKLSIPEFDPSEPLHVSIAKAGEATATSVVQQLEQLREERGSKLTVTIARRELRKWLRASAEGKAVEEVVGELLGGG